jgi:hypothetical protein
VNEVIGKVTGLMSAQQRLSFCFINRLTWGLCASPIERNLPDI